MIEILPVSELVAKRIERFGLGKKFAKAIELFENNPCHPGLHVELLEPKAMGIYSFRLDRKYRDLFIYRADKAAIEILNVTKHYE